MTRTGQDVYQSANELFFTHRSIVLLVFDLRDEDLEELETWSTNISLHIPDSPIILVGTHAGLNGPI